MPMNQKGLTLLELLAIIVIATAVLLPLLSGFIDNFAVNERMHARRASSSLGNATVESLDKVDFNDLLTFLGDDPIKEIEEDDCDGFSTSGEEVDNTMSSREVCGYIFDQEWSNVTFEGDAFRVFLLPYDLDEDDLDTLRERDDLPDRVIDGAEALDIPEEKEAGSFLNVFVWMEYDPAVSQSILIEGIVEGAIDLEE